MAGNEVPADLKAKVFRAREKESHVIRASLRPTPLPGPAPDCARCHHSFDQFRSAEPASATPASFIGKKLDLVPDKQGTDMAHAIGLLGYNGLRVTAQLAPQVTTILTEPQKRIMQDFACCLIPPSELSDPVRAGQADVSDAGIELLRKVRSAPAAYWPVAQTNTINNLKRMFVARNPELTDHDLAAIESKLSSLFDRVRTMSDAEFEMNKDSLCIELKMQKTSQLSGRQQSFKAAVFLLMPGVADIYDALQKRSRNK